MGHVQYPSGSGLRLPGSGQLLGLMADFLRLKGFLRESEAISSKTAQRYFDGKPVEPESVAAILDALVEPLLAEHLIESEPFGSGFDTKAWARSSIEILAHRWDALVAQMSSGYFPIVSIEDAPLPFLRMVVLDAGLRWGAYQALRAAHDHEPVLMPRWLAHDSLRQVMDEIRAQKTPQPPLPKLAKEVLVSKNTLDSWRAGTSIPTESNLDALAGVLAKMVGGDAAHHKARLRLSVGVAAAWHRLAELCGREHVQNLVEGFQTTARRAYEYFKWLPLPLNEGERRLALVQVVNQGAKCMAGAAASEHMAGLCELNEQVGADFYALPGDWAPRISYWNSWNGTVEPAAQHYSQRFDRPLEEIRAVMRGVKAIDMRMANFDRSEKEVLADAKEKGMTHTVMLTGDNKFKAANRFRQAEIAWSAGNRETAFTHIRRALELEPDSASHHMYLGAWLGHLVMEERLEFVEEALMHLRIAAQLEPGWQLPVTEIGIVLSNAGQLEKAEEAFAAAEPLARQWSHFHFTRGNNLMWMGRLEDAEKCFRRAIELEPNGVHEKAHLTAVLMKLGKQKEAEKLAREVAQRGAGNVLPVWETILDQRPNRHVR